MAHRIKRLKIIGDFRAFGFKDFSSFLNVCLFFTSKFSTIELSMWWRNDLQNMREVQKINNYLIDVLEFLKYE